MKSFGKLLLFLFLVCINSIYAAEVEFYFYPNEFAVGEQAKLEVKAFGDKPFKTNISNLQKNGIQIRFLGSGTETQIINFRVSKSQILNFSVVAEKEGNFNLPEISVSYDNKIYTSPPIDFKVVGKLNTRGRDFFSPFISDADTETISPEVAFHTNKSQAYVGEPIVGYYVLYYNQYRHPYFERDPNQPISFPFFLSDTLKQVTVQIEPLVNRNGHERNTLVYEKEIYALTSLKPGNFTLGSTKFIVGDSLKFLSNEEGYEVTPQTVVILDLPKPAPKNYKGAIGNYTIQYVNLPSEAYQKDRLYFEIGVSGEGGGEGIFPEIEPTNPSIRLVSERRSRSFQKLSKGNFGFFAKTIFLFSMPTGEENEITTPKVSLPFFSLESKKYIKIELLPRTIKLIPKPLRKEIHQNQTSVPFTTIAFYFFVMFSIFFIGFGLRRFYLYKKRQSKFVDWNLWIGKKRGIFLRDYLLKRGYEKTQVDYLVQLKDNYPNSDYKDMIQSLSKTELKIFTNTLDRLKIGD
ncbi:MAG: BatD family protein [Leptospira sp.]|nr:BatD family protein [Leptospira sp.]